MTRYSVASDTSVGTGGKSRNQAPPIKILQEVANRGITGSLTIQDQEDASVSWQVYVTSERLTYATSSMGKEVRLPYLMQRFSPKIDLAELQVEDHPHKSEYIHLCQWCRSGRFPLEELRRLLLRCSQEALAQAIAVNRATLQFRKGDQPDPMVLSVPVLEVIGSVKAVMRRWEQVRPQLPSAFARLDLNNQRMDHFCEHWEQSQTHPEPVVAEMIRSQQMSACIRLLSQKITLYEIAHTLKTDPLVVATWLHPLVMADTIKVLPFKEAERRTVIACIDDSKTVHRQVQLTLQSVGYDVLSITEPSQALTALVRHRPALILMDVNMPEIDGYELSRMLRQSKQLREIPIVMLTGRDGLLDRLQARMLGVTEYLTKPFDPERLLQVVQKMAQDRPQQGVPLEE